MSWNTKIKLLQGLCFFGGPLVLLFDFNLEYLLYSMLASWFIVHLGVSCALHRGFSHRTWEPRNKFILVVLHFLSLICVVGSTITWSGTHRLHHKYSETDKDPHWSSNKSIWVKIKYWFNYWPTHAVSPKTVKDLTSDPLHKFFHRNYFKILLAYMVILFVISPTLFMYGFMVTTMFSLHTISWITVGAHIFGHQDNNTGDSSRNTYLMGYFSWGEGWHNNHHARPGSYEFGRHWYQLDIGKWAIKLMAKKNESK